MNIISGLPLSTQKDYRHKLRPFIHFLDGRKPNRQHLIEYREYLIGNITLSPATKAKYFAVAKSMLRQVSELNGRDITVGITGIRKGAYRHKEGINDDEMGRITCYLSTSKNPKMVRVRAIVLLMAQQGLRRIEVSRLNIEDLDLNLRSINGILAGIAWVHGKGYDDKEPIYLHKSTVWALLDYIKLFNLTEGALFRSEAGITTGMRLSEHGVWRIVRRDLLDPLEIKKVPHGFRHYFVTKLIEEFKGDLFIVMKYTRHRSIATLQMYYDNMRIAENLPQFEQAFRRTA